AVAALPLAVGRSVLGHATVREGDPHPLPTICRVYLTGKHLGTLNLLGAPYGPGGIALWRTPRSSSWPRMAGRGSRAGEAQPSLAPGVRPAVAVRRFVELGQACLDVGGADVLRGR